MRTPMTRSIGIRTTVALVGALAVTIAPPMAVAQQFTQPASITHVAAPVLLDNSGLFQERFAKVGDDVFIAGQPTERGLKRVHDEGVTVVVNLRSPEEMKRIGFDEAAAVAALGMRYVYLPVRGTADMPYSPTTLDKFAEAVKGANGKVLLHCTIAWRASHLWAAYLIRERGIPVDSALANARAINLMDTMRMGDQRQPVEDFLDRSLPSIGHPGRS
jgi:uncharacterized protein (TIGR01244 family)